MQVIQEVLGQWQAVDAGGIAIALVVGAVIGLCIGLTSVGAGVMLIPSLSVFLGLDYAVSVMTAALYSVIVKLYAVIAHWRLGNIDLRRSLLFLGGGLPGAVVASVTVKNLSRDPVFRQGLGWVVLAVACLSAMSIFLNLRRRRRRARVQAAEGLAAEPDDGHGHDLTGGRVALGLAVGLVVGGIMGATSIGGAAVIPVFVICLGMPMARTVGSSIFCLVVIMVTTSAVYLLLPVPPVADAAAAVAKHPHVLFALLTAAGSLVGVSIGSRLTRRLHPDLLQGVVILQILLAIGLLVLQLTGVIGG